MLCVITHIRKDLSYPSESYHRKQVKNIIKILFRGLSEDEFNFNLDFFWTDYTDFDQKNDSFDGDQFIWEVKDVIDGNINLWNCKYWLPSAKVLHFVACRVTSKVTGIGASKRSWGDVKTIKSGKKSAIISDVSQKQSIFYTYAFIESAIT